MAEKRSKGRKGKKSKKPEVYDPSQIVWKSFEMELEPNREIPESWKRELWPPKTFPKEAIEFWKKSEKNQEIENKWLDIVVEKDPLEAMIGVEKDLESLPIERNIIWSELRDPMREEEWHGSPHLLPFFCKHADIINDILIKSYETQASSCRDISVRKDEDFKDRDQCLVSGHGRDVHGMLLYYFKCLNVAEDLKMVIGVTETDKSLYGFRVRESNSWLKQGRGPTGYVINNFYSSKMPPEMNRAVLEHFTTFLDEDPGLEKFTEDPKFRSAVGAQMERTLFTPDQAMEQHIVIYSALGINGPFRNALYDVKMRSYIKEKYGVEIESLTSKWSKLCWECGEASEDLKKCANCKMARYCSKLCQVKDWKRKHKQAHSSSMSHFLDEIQYCIKRANEKKDE